MFELNVLLLTLEYVDQTILGRLKSLEIFQSGTKGGDRDQ